ncbi:pirin-like C-terminal cupin domain-containing protein [Nitrospira calida]
MNAPPAWCRNTENPLRKPIARYGPFVMNSQEEIEQTLLELRGETFVIMSVKESRELEQRRLAHAPYTRLCSQRPHCSARTLRL